MDGWCRVAPVAWLPVAFDYRLEPDPAYVGRYGPLAFEDPWWKVVLIVLAVLLAIASLVYDYVNAGQDPQYIIGKVLRNGDAATNLIDCAVCSLNGSRGTDLGELDAQSDDVNNGLPDRGPRQRHPARPKRQRRLRHPERRTRQRGVEVRRAKRDHARDG